MIIEVLYSSDFSLSESSEEFLDFGLLFLIAFSTVLVFLQILSVYLCGWLSLWM